MGRSGASFDLLETPDFPWEKMGATAAQGATGMEPPLPPDHEPQCGSGCGLHTLPWSVPLCWGTEFGLLLQVLSPGETRRVAPGTLRPWMVSWSSGLALIVPQAPTPGSSQRDSHGLVASQGQLVPNKLHCNSSFQLVVPGARPHTLR